MTNLIVSLGMELGSWQEQNEQKYFVLVGNTTHTLTKLQFDLYFVGQKALYTIEAATNTLQLPTELVQQTIHELIEMGVVIYWNALIDEAFFKQYTLAPRGMAAKYTSETGQALISSTQAEPVAIDLFGHALWVYSNGLIAIDTTLKRMAIDFEMTYDECVEQSLFFIPTLIRQGLAVLNPIEVRG